MVVPSPKQPLSLLPHVIILPSVVISTENSYPAITSTIVSPKLKEMKVSVLTGYIAEPVSPFPTWPSQLSPQAHVWPRLVKTIACPLLVIFSTTSPTSKLNLDVKSYGVIAFCVVPSPIWR